MTAQKSDEGISILAENRKARFDYHIVEKYEAGLVLTGAEVKSIRNGGSSIGEAYVRPEEKAAWLLNARISPYSHLNSFVVYDPVRPRKLLLHAREITELFERVAKKGLTIVPLKLYLKKGKIKIELGLVKGKDKGDKRDTIIAREKDREIAAIMRGKR